MSDLTDAELLDLEQYFKIKDFGEPTYREDRKAVGLLIAEVRQHRSLLDRLRETLHGGGELGCPGCGQEYKLDGRTPDYDSAAGHLPDCVYVELMGWKSTA